MGTGKEARVIFFRLNIYGYTVSMGAFVKDVKDDKNDSLIQMAETV